MKKNLLIAIICLINLIAFGQSNYTIKKIGSNYSEQQINDAFNDADFCGYYFNSKNHEIHFNDGTIVLLISKNQESNFIYKPECVVNDDTFFPEAIWSISESGIIVRKLSTKTK